MSEDQTTNVIKLELVADELKTRLSSLNGQLDSLKEQLIQLKNDRAEKEKLTTLASTYKRDKAVALAVGGALAVFLTAFGFVDVHNIGRVISDKEVQAAQNKANSAATTAQDAATKATAARVLADNAATQAATGARQAMDTAVATAVQRANEDINAAKARAEQAAKQTEQTATKADSYFHQITSNKVEEKKSNPIVFGSQQPNSQSFTFGFPVTHAWLDFAQLSNVTLTDYNVQIQGNTVTVDIIAAPQSVGYGTIRYSVFALAF
jgi:hypothetical protein